MEYKSAINHKKEWNLAFGDNMYGPEDIMINEVTQTERQILYDLIYM